MSGALASRSGIPLREAMSLNLSSGLVS